MWCVNVSYDGDSTWSATFRLKEEALKFSDGLNQAFEKLAGGYGSNLYAEAFRTYPVQEYELPQISDAEAVRLLGRKPGPNELALDMDKLARKLEEQKKIKRKKPVDNTPPPEEDIEAALGSIMGSMATQLEES